MKGHLRLLNIACAAKAKWRQITLQKPSRESPLLFNLLGGSERGFGIFVEAVEKGSKAAETGLKRGDQVRLRGSHSAPHHVRRFSYVRCFSQLPRLHSVNLDMYSFVVLLDHGD